MKLSTRPRFPLPTRQPGAASVLTTLCPAPVIPPGWNLRNETLANLSYLPGLTIDAVQAVPDAKALIEAGASVQATRSLPHAGQPQLHSCAGTVLGPVTLTRAWNHCAQCGHGLAPRDAELGAAGESLSPGLAAPSWRPSVAGPG